MNETELPLFRCDKWKVEMSVFLCLKLNPFLLTSGPLKPGAPERPGGPCKTNDKSFSRYQRVFANNNKINVLSLPLLVTNYYLNHGLLAKLIQL